MDHGYSERAAQKLVGDRFQLVVRQRNAVRRAACSAAELSSRASRLVPAEAVFGRSVAIDGFNVLITVESALGGGLVLVARDGCVRDLANLRGTWRRVAETKEAIERVGEQLVASGASEVVWYLDQGVSNSGRLRGVLEGLAEERGYPWRASVIRGVDAELRRSKSIVASADSGVLAGCERWMNLARLVVEERVPDAWVVDLSLAAPVRKQ